MKTGHSNHKIIFGGILKFLHENSHEKPLKRIKTRLYFSDLKFVFFS